MGHELGCLIRHVSSDEPLQRIIINKPTYRSSISICVLTSDLSVTYVAVTVYSLKLHTDRLLKTGSQTGS